MGSDEHSDEKPAHKVRMSYPFAIGQYEVTYAEWNRCVEAGACRYRPNHEGSPNDAIGNPSWDDVNAYLKWLSETTGQVYRLPSGRNGNTRPALARLSGSGGATRPARAKPIAPIADPGGMANPRLSALTSPTLSAFTTRPGTWPSGWRIAGMRATKELPLMAQLGSPEIAA
jgi:hypothetical protein